MTRLAAPLGLALGILAGLAVFGLGEAIDAAGMNPFAASDANPPAPAQSARSVDAAAGMGTTP